MCTSCTFDGHFNVFTRFNSKTKIYILIYCTCQLKIKYQEYHKPLSIEDMVHLVNLLKLLKIQKKIDQFFKKSGNKDKVIDIYEINSDKESDEFDSDVNNEKIIEDD